MITRDQIINEVIKAYPETIGVFNEFRVDSCCGGGRAIAETAAADGLEDLTPLLHALNRATRGFGEKDLGFVVAEIEKTHHAYLKEEVPLLQEEVARLARETQEGPAAAHAQELHEALSRLAAEIGEHLFKEEQILFPTIGRLDRALKGEEPLEPSVLGCGAQGPVTQMNFEHEMAKEGLDKIAQALGSLEATGAAGEAVSALRPRLERLRDDLLEHIRAEEEELFPRALELEAEVLGKLRQAVSELE